jgi:uncharacterized membrane protein YgcG
MKKILLIILLAGLPASVRSAEEILGFGSRIGVSPDAAIVVTETIRVLAEGDRIKRGIYRDFPTLYSGPAGLRVEVPFEVLEILRDGKPEPWRSERQANGVRIYLGSADVFLPHGETTYTIKYRTGGQIGFFKEFDELYWNVTGNGWAFPILQASASVELPPGAAPISVVAYTGPSGAKSQDYRRLDRAGILLETTSPLAPGEGFTIAVSWPKGFVREPSSADRLIETAKSNRGLLAAAVGMLAVFGYFLVAWRLVGRDPASGVIVPLFAPPDGFSPQDVRYLAGLGTLDNTSLTAAVMWLAVRRVISITGSDNGSYQLERRGASGLDGSDVRLVEALFSGGGTKLSLTKANHAALASARKVLAKDLAEKCGPYFSRNTSVWVAGLIATLVPLGISLLDAKEVGGAVFLMAWLGIWSLGCAALSHAVLTAWRGKSKWTALPVTLFSIPFLAGWVFGFWALTQALSLWVCAIYLAGIALCAVFQHLLKRPTPEGQQLRDHIRGFKQYLSVAESERLGLENPPERTPELFEKFLPFALALGVEQAWSEKFSDVLAAALIAPDSGVAPPSFPLATANAFAGALGGAISSASTAPGSSSGSGGGGSSGGGGGGGGGGGW